MTYTTPIFEGGIGGDGATFTPIQPGAATQADPVVVTPTPAITPTPATTITVAQATPAPVPTPRRAATALPVPVVEGIARYSAADYASAARALMPRGRAWSTDPDGQQSRVLAALGRALERIDAAASGLLAGTMPGAMSEMLPEWEASLGLPDPCVGDAPTIAQRLDQVRGRFTGAGGQSRQHYLDFAAALGFRIAITVYKPGQASLPDIGLASDSIGWMFVWAVTLIEITGDLPLGALMCELAAIKPAETTLLLLNPPLMAEDGNVLLSSTGSPLEPEDGSVAIYA